VKLVIGSVTVVDPDRQLARELAREKVALYLPVVAPLDPTLQVEPGLLVRLRSAGQQGDWRSAGRLISDDLLDRFCIAGDAGDIVRQVEELYDSGVDRVEFGTPHGVDQAAGISILGSKVIPAL
jgi:5,10-methylenetetrahydromethanopterin reductase